MPSPAPPSDRAEAGLLVSSSSPETSSSPLPSTHRKTVLTWENVSYTVGTAEASNEHTLLRHVSGYVRSGEMLAVLGPSGAGKTTLLDILAQRKTSKMGRRSGEICVNGAPIDPIRFRRESGYVQQDDLTHSYVTVEEAVRFSATLRTPPTVSPDELDERVTRVLKQLGIYNVRHRCIGSALVRGVSGGERKRCAVAAEMVTSPAILFLDEPTTGLDTFTAMHLLLLLRSLAQTGVAVIFSIHQPRSRIYEVFDRVLLLNSVGEVAFFGPAAQALSFFVEIGLPCTYPSNPADYLLDAVSTPPADEEQWPLRDSEVAVAEHHSNSGGTQHLSPPVAPGEKGRWANVVSSSPTQGRDIAAAFASLRLPGVLQQIRELQCEFRVVVPPRISSATVENEKAGAYFRGWGTQVRCIALRYLRNRRRDPVATYVSISSAIIFAFLTGTIYYQVGTTQDSIRSRMGVLFFIMMISTFSSLGSLEMFLVDRAIYAREHRSGMYSTSAYYVGKVIQDVPVGIAVNAAFVVIVYFLVGLQLSLIKFLVFYGVCSLVMLNGYALCLLMSNVSTNYATANIITSLLLVLYLLPTGGMLVSLNSIPFVWRWIKYVSFVRYAFSTLVASEFDGLTLVCDTNSSALTPCITSGTAYTESQGMYPRDIVPHTLFVVCSMFVYLLLGYFALRCWRSAEGK
ncbi:putative ATP-binding cassette protein [Leptomonas pyrrhocoris]|uniref:Putative ATP-binding cassette protein n=1 Tax=Leptomonas pyrrhocoris TaxID=157538 RepID=A0A0M9G396_LEPPY|nr:putative ATP-binding cassette protein [Leptomonas pyrrhocoris]KPA81256.1 putative ATP-binding cassette protein [Leptomonas pyrrhocoris]|eukprot:XP_015659695.1 putative ATP-binding cassette protein [Leptomonas pyrrhocoris]